MNSLASHMEAFGRGESGRGRGRARKLKAGWVRRDEKRKPIYRLMLRQCAKKICEGNGIMHRWDKEANIRSSKIIAKEKIYLVRQEVKGETESEG